MPAPIKIRTSYSNDSTFLLRLKEAVEKDHRIDNVTKSGVLTSIDSLVTKLIAADVEVRKYESLAAQAV